MKIVIAILIAALTIPTASVVEAKVCGYQMVVRTNYHTGHSMVRYIHKCS